MNETPLDTSLQGNVRSTEENAETRRFFVEPEWFDTLDASSIKQQLVEDKVSLPEAFSLRCLDVVDSTNLRIKQAIAEREPEGLVITAVKQEGGYGRQGRLWSSPPGGLYISFLLRPESRLPDSDKTRLSQRFPTLSLVISLAVRRTFVALGAPEAVQIKWPNDVLCEQGKLAGISVELIDDAVCLGIGLNIFHPSDEKKPEGKYNPAFMFDIRSVDGCVLDGADYFVNDKGLSLAQKQYMEDAAAVLLHEVFSVYNQWLVEGFSPFRSEYRSHASLQGQEVQLVSLANDILYEGVVCDVDADGFLCLRDANGDIVRAHSGEVHLK